MGDDPPSLASLQNDLDDLPDGYTHSDEIMFRAYHDSRLVAYSEVLRGFEGPMEWIIGIVLVDPEHRCNGLGQRVLERIAADAAVWGATTLAVGVIVSRTRSLCFWNREGFTHEVRRRPITVAGFETEVVRLQRQLAQA
jgi:GNAT superfamily N-acetyltransferase